MLETARTMLGKMPRRRVVGALAGIAAVGIAAAVWVSNAGPGTASECPVQPQARDAVDAAATGQLAALNATASGRGYADLAFQDATGRPMTLADFSGKPILVNFWATWCTPCREEMPDLDNLAARYDTETFEVVPINLDLGADGVTKAQKFMDEENLPNLGLYADPSYEAFERLKREAVAIGLPASLLLDGNGCEIAVLQGPAPWDAPDGIAVIDALIAATGGGGAG